MGHLVGAISQAKLDEQRGVVQNEKREDENVPYGKVWDFLTPKLYPSNHPYSWTTIGSMEDLDAAKLDDVKAWFQTYYGAANAVVVIAGDMDAKTAREKVEHYFGDIPAGPPVARQNEWTARRTGSQRGQMQDRVPQARLYKVWNVPSWSSADAEYLNLVSSVLSDGKSSRAGAISGRRADAGGAAAGQDPVPRGVHPRDRAGRRLRRQVGCAGAG